MSKFKEEADLSYIKERIRELNSQIEEIFYSDFFVLNEQLMALMAEKKNVQGLCPHHFEGNICSYCGIEKGEVM